MKKLIFISSALLLIASPAVAATFSSGQNYTLDKATTINDDLYAAAGSPVISGTILGDAFIAGGNVTFNGSAKSGLMAAGGTLTILGTVGGSVRAAGGTVTLSGPVGADAVIGGGTVTIIDGATIGRDAALAGGQINLSAKVGRNATIRGGDIVIDGTINGNVDVQASKTLTLGDHAVIKGTLTYTAPIELAKSPGAVVMGEVTYNPTKNPGHYDAAGVLAGFVGLLFVFKLLALAGAVIIATTLFNRSTATVVNASLDSVWKNLCIGFAALIALPFVFVFLLISVIGALFGILGFIGYITLIILAKITSAILVGAFFTKWYRKEALVTWQWALLGLIALELVSLIPVIGWLVATVVFLTALGALASLTYYWISEAR